MNNSFDVQIDLMEKASLQLSSETFLIDRLKKNSFKNKDSAAKLQNYISHLFTYTKISWTEIDNLFIYDLNGNKIGHKDSDVAIPNPRIKDFQVSDTSIEYGVLLNNDSRLKDGVVSFLRLVKDPETFKPIGWIRLDLKIYNLNSIRNINNDSRMFIVMRPNGRMIYTNKPDQLNIIVISKLLETINDKGSFIFYDKNEKKLVNYYKSKKSNWIVLSIVPEKNLNQGLRKARSFSITLVSISILISILAAFVISRRITLPLRNLHFTMKKVEKGDLKTRASVTSKDEIGELGNQMNSMIESVDTLINQVYQIEIKNREAQIKALSAQINPHFLYNTLEAVDILSLKGQKKEVQMIVLSLSKMMRYAFRKGTIVSLDEELEHLDAFLQIQKAKYSEKVTISIQIPDELKRVKIPKLTLQPIVENSFKYGFFQKSDDNQLSISIMQNSKEIQIHILDNGMGVTPDRLAYLNTWFNDPFFKKEDGKHIGLMNVNERIRLNLGNQYGLQAYSEEGQWFKIIITLPLSFK
ncbi:sensor histidine kinase [Bacillus sp. UNC438CL73TsuS30]|uniref:sensor histidine kinase n=1 Tax=Bacillus sp. UNC438CL73TsuS30 TaxID=1340434 RepID=UPI0012DD50E2|nr:sensor histidine kinase [Bacillus sp. UNC438CL73TsuS30]